MEAALEQFEGHLKLFQVFWGVMDHLDANAWVLEPDPPSRAHTFRRIALPKHCSVHVEIVRTGEVAWVGSIGGALT